MTWTTLRERGPRILARHFAVAAAGGQRAIAEPVAAALAARMERMVRRHESALEPHLVACAAFEAPPQRVGSLEVVCGTRDRLVDPELQRDLADRLEAPLVVVPHAAHQLPWEAPDELVAAAERRFAQVATAHD